VALQFSVAARNNRLDTFESSVGVNAKLYLFSGAVPANCAAADPAGLLAMIVLPGDWMAAASGGTKAKSGVWAATAIDAGTIQSFRIKDSTGTVCHAQGTVGTGSGDLSLDNAAVIIGKVVTVTGLVITDGNA
jgi:hypothetical protein